MLTFTGQGTSQTCNGVTRRDFLQAGTLGAIGLGLPQYLTAVEAGKVDPSKSKRSAIMIFNLGAPSQIDTFDMKPDAPDGYRSLYKTIPTSVPGMSVCEHLPETAKVMHRIAQIRSHPLAEPTDHVKSRRREYRQNTGDAEQR